MWQPNSALEQGQGQKKSEVLFVFHYLKTIYENIVNFQAVKSIFSDFCSNTTINGIRYFTERKRHWSERLWWIVAFGLSLYLCGESIRSILTNWIDSPVTMSFAEKPASISEIPFPTITICPEAKATKNKIHSIAASLPELWQSLYIMKDEEFEQFTAIAHVCNIWTPVGPSYANESIYHTIENMALEIDSTLDVCRWNYDVISCSAFSPVFTEDGLCFTFNALNSHEIFTSAMAPNLMVVKENPNVTHWDLQNGYTNGAWDDGSYPMRIFNAKPMGALSAELQLFKEDVGFKCHNLNSAFQVFIHLPGEIPSISRLSFQIPPQEEVKISLKATLITTSDGLQMYEPNRRQCYFDSERQLQFFKIYTQNNCEAECLANFTLIECGCVKLSMPREKETNICGMGKMECYINAKAKLFDEDIIEGLKDPVARTFRKECNCLPSCTAITYEGDIERTAIDPVPNVKYWRSRVGVSFKTHQVISLKRSEAYTIANFLSTCGGLLGLFLGVSALSVTEFIYYFSLRLFWTIRKWKPTTIIVAPFKRRTIPNISSNLPNA